MSNTQTVFSRKEIADILRKRVLSFKDGYRQNVAILGDELIGKTTLLKDFLDSLGDEKIAPVYVEIVAYEFPLFIKRVCNSLLYHFLKKSQLTSTRENLDLLLGRAQGAIPETGRLMSDLLASLDREKPETIFKQLFGVMESFTLETKKNCVIIFDEFHNLKTLGIKNICQELGKKIMFEKNSLFLFASSSKNEAKDILVNELSLLFGNFETLELQMLDTAECDTLIANRLGEIKATPEIIKFLIHFTGGQPFYLKIICDEAATACRADRKNILDHKTLAGTLERLLFQEWGLFYLKFTTYLSLVTLGRNKNELIYLLDAIATGKNRLKDMTAALRRQKTEISQRLHRLIDIGIVSKNGSFYVINDRLLSFWLRFVHAEKLNSLSPDHSEQAQHFRANIETEIERFIETSAQDIPRRMVDLFNLFEGEEVLVDRKKFHLAPFKELRIVSFDDSQLKVGIFGRSHEGLWLAAIKEDGISEQDINALLTQAKKLKAKTINKIIIGLGTIERNARLLAKESHVATWDIRQINNLFDYFGKPRIVK